MIYRLRFFASKMNNSMMALNRSFSDFSKLKIGFVGCGNITKAMIEGMLKSEKITKDQLKITEKNEFEYKIKDLGLTPHSLGEMIKTDVIFLCVKPKDLKNVLPKINNSLVVSAAASTSIEKLESMIPETSRVIRIMPNVASAVNSGITAISAGEKTTKEDLEVVKKLVETFGISAILSDDLLDSFVGISGSAIAFFFVAIEALADGGVALGFQREFAINGGASAMLGAAKMILDQKRHPAELKDSVASPGGSTMAGICALEENKFRDAIIKAVIASARHK